MSARIIADGLWEALVTDDTVTTRSIDEATYLDVLTNLRQRLDDEIAATTASINRNNRKQES